MCIRDRSISDHQRLNSNYQKKSETQGRGKLCPARGLQGPSVAQSMQPGYHDDDHDASEEGDLFSKKELRLKLGVYQVEHVQH